MSTHQSAIVIGGGFAGLSAAIALSHKGYKVDLLEKNSQLGGRARTWTSEGFTFDLGPSWYWMPDVFESFFARFGKKVSDYYTLERLDPGYEVFFERDKAVVDADLSSLKKWMEKLEPGSYAKLTQFLKEAAYKYEVGIKDLVYKPSRSIIEFADVRILKGLFQMQVLTSMRKHVNKFFTHPHLRQLMEFPILFLGAVPSNTPALYSLMNYADLKLGTWYPMGGMHEVVKAMVKLAEESGVHFHTDCEVQSFSFETNRIQSVNTTKESFKADVVIAGADYHHIDRHLLPEKFANYSEKYWDKRKMAPSSLLFYLGVNKKLEGLTHHALFFDADFDDHADAIYTDARWPEKPLFYVSTPSKTDPSVAPEGQEAVTLLIPLAPGLEDSEEMREKYFNMIMERLENRIGQSIRDHIVVKRSYAMKDFVADYHAYKGNAYGLANTLSQTAVLKPSLKSKKVSNLYYTGQLTVPGPGVPPSLISGLVVADEVQKDIKQKAG